LIKKIRMEPLTWGFIGTLIGTLVGASASILTTYLNNQNSVKLIREQDRLNRDSSFREFQKENYLKIQEAFHNTVRLTSLINIEDVKLFKETGRWQESISQDHSHESLRSSLRDLAFYEQRIQNDGLREDLNRIRGKLSRVYNSLSMSESNEIMMDLLTNDYEKFISDIGNELRSNY